MAINLYVDTDSGVNSVGKGTGTGSDACATLNYLLNTSTSFPGGTTLSDNYIIHCKGSVADGTATIPSYTPDGKTLTIQVDSSDRPTNMGEWDETKYRISVSAADCIILGAANLLVNIYGLQIKIATAADTVLRTCINSAKNGTTLNVESCLLYGDADTGDKKWVGVGFGGVTSINSKIQNCAFYSTSSSGNTVCAVEASYLNGTNNIYIYNNSFKKCKTAIALTSTTSSYVKNCGFVDCTTSIDGTPTGTATNSTTTPTFDTGKEFHLASNDTTWKGQGTDLSGDSGIINSLDIDGVTRTGAWAIGCDQAAGATNYTRLAYELS